jgi:hypothetical protein
MPVGQVGDTNTQGLKILIGQSTLNGQEILIVQQVAQAAHQHAAGLAHLLRVGKRPPIY